MLTSVLLPLRCKVPDNNVDDGISADSEVYGEGSLTGQEGKCVAALPSFLLARPWTPLFRMAGTSYVVFVFCFCSVQQLVLTRIFESYQAHPPVYHLNCT